MYYQVYLVILIITRVIEIATIATRFISFTMVNTRSYKRYSGDVWRYEGYDGYC